MHFFGSEMARARAVAVALVTVACGPGGSDDDGSTTAGGETTVGGTTGVSAGTSGETTDTPTSAPTGETSDGTSAATSAGATETTDGTTGPGVCTAPPLTDEQVDALAFGIFGDQFEAQPGDQLNLKLGVLECCSTVEPVDACVEYSLTPAEGATYDDASGTLTIEDSVTAGTMFKLTADVESGRKIVVAEILVYTPESNPFVGFWYEVAQISCDPGPTVDPDPAINELWFRANGEVMVTWFPFETYVDYWGTYAFDLASGQIDIMVDGGNYVPPDVDGEGEFLIDGGELTLSDMWLGSAQDFMGVPACGQRFER